MPAFQLQQFQKQLDQLLHLFALPTEFHQALTRMFERYEQPSYRYGVGVKAPPEPAYHIQSLMLEEMENELKRMAVERPRSALLLTRECWQDAYYETRRIAATVMGHTPMFDLALYQEIFLEMLDTAGEKDYLLMAFRLAGKSLREQEFQLLEEMLPDWLDGDNRTQHFGFAAIQSLITTKDMNHLPTIYRLIEKFVVDGETAYREDILDIMDGLVSLSPMETAHFLSELTTHFYGEERMRYFRALCRSFEKPERDFINQSFMDRSAYYHEEDVVDD